MKTKLITTITTKSGQTCAVAQCGPPRFRIGPSRFFIGAIYINADEADEFCDALKRALTQMKPTKKAKP